jgi:hypothetical protein
MSLLVHFHLSPDNRPEASPTERLSSRARSSIRLEIAIWARPDVIVAQGAVAHPFRDLVGQTRPDFDIEDLTHGTSMPGVQANALTAKRMLGVRDHDKLRSVF